MDQLMAMHSEGRFDHIREATAFTHLLHLLRSDSEMEELSLEFLFKYSQREKEALEKIPEVFALIKTVKKLYIQLKGSTNNVLVARALKAGMSNEFVNYVSIADFRATGKVAHVMSEAFHERVTDLELSIWRCSPKFVQIMVEASFSKCFSLDIREIRAIDLETTLMKHFIGERLRSLTLQQVKGLKDNLFIKLSRCISLLPSLKKFDFGDTPVPSIALRHFPLALKDNLTSGQSGLLQVLNLCGNELDERSIFCYFRLVNEDLIGNMSLSVKKNVIKDDLSLPVVKSISSAVANTTNLKYFSLGKLFTSGTSFDSFKLQNNNISFYSPFKINRKLQN